MAFFQGRHLWVKQLDDVAELHFGGPGEAASLLSPPCFAELERALDEILKHAKFRMLLVHVGKGGRAALELDLEALGKISAAEEWQRLAENGQQAARRLAQFELPTVAMMAGACLGPDLQLALACDYRVLIDRPGTQLGFPELELGLLPFWGATHRLPRLIGLEPTLKLLLTGRRLRAAEALAWGLVDAVSLEGQGDPPAFLENPQKQPRPWLPKRTWRQWLVESHPPGRWLLFTGGRRLAQRRFPEDMAGPWRTLDALRQGLKRGPEEAERLEAEALAELGESSAWHNLLRLYRQRDQIRAEYLPKDRSDRFRQVGVIGVDGRGAALAVLAATRNTQVVLQEKDDLSLGLALMVVLNLFEQEMARGGLNPAEMKKNLNAIKATTNYRDFQNLELVLLGGDEPIEDLATTLAALEEKVGDQTIIASTDPTLSVRELVPLVRRSYRLACLHFQTPAGRSLLVEVVPAKNMPEEKVRRLMEWVAHLGRTPRRVPDGPGFLFNRLLVPYLLEAVLLVEEGIRTDLVDQALVSFGMVHGPLEHLDLMGVDVVARIADRLAETESRLVEDDALAFMIEKGWLGQKSGVGFYRYRRGKRRLHHRLMSELRDRGRRRRSEHLDILSKADQRQKAVERLVFLWINEAARCLEGYLTDAAELDLTMSLAGWAPHHGGPLTYARTLGKEKVLETLDRLEKRHGERYKASAWLHGDW